MKRVTFHGFVMEVGKKVKDVDEAKADRVGLVEDVEIYDYHGRMICKDDDRWRELIFPPPSDNSEPC